jgi:hypothetical protein
MKNFYYSALILINFFLQSEVPVACFALTKHDSPYHSDQEKYRCQLEGQDIVII